MGGGRTLPISIPSQLCAMGNVLLGGIDRGILSAYVKILVCNRIMSCTLHNIVDT